MYVTYQDSAGPDMPTTLVQILDDSSTLPQTETSNRTEEVLENSLVMAEQSNELQLENFNDADNLPLNTRQLQVKYYFYKL